MRQDKKGGSNGITDKKHAGCFVTSFCSSHPPEKTTRTSLDPSKEPLSKVQSHQPVKNNSTSNFVGQAGLPTCKMLIMGDFTHSSQRKEKYLSSIKWQKLPDDRAPKFYSEKTADHKLIMHDISSCDINSFNVILRRSTYIAIIPSSAKDFSLCCHALFDKDPLLSEGCRVVYLNLAEQHSPEYSAIEDEANKWTAKEFDLSSVEVASISELVEEAVGHTKAVSQRFLDTTLDTTRNGM